MSESRSGSGCSRSPEMSSCRVNRGSLRNTRPLWQAGAPHVVSPHDEQYPQRARHQMWLLVGRSSSYITATYGAELWWLTGRLVRRYHVPQARCPSRSPGLCRPLWARAQTKRSNRPSPAPPNARGDGTASTPRSPTCSQRRHRQAVYAERQPISPPPAQRRRQRAVAAAATTLRPCSHGRGARGVGRCLGAGAGHGAAAAGGSLGTQQPHQLLPQVCLVPLRRRCQLLRVARPPRPCWHTIGASLLQAALKVPLQVEGGPDAL
jgi:hypothetical protein